MDTKTTISSTEARKNFAEVINNIDRGSVRYTLTVNGKPKVIMINAEEFEGWQETIEIMSDPKLVKSIKKAEAELDRGEFVTLDEMIKAEASRKN